MKRRNLYIPEDLWGRIQRAALEAGLAEGQPVSASEWVRGACEHRLERHERHVARLRQIYDKTEGDR